ncbi:CHY zinc finger protein [Sporosarcina luteola]|uniref:CHY zinc finger protein n=1 Tax=Sporosarcina luteola TaxID=582850 RepID=UPI00203D9931|nr:CHY zinc finger protein [Sporosarcina luteola]MCM3744451.1 CHY zinc finger protein [Sporosarcina luteola]
MIHVSGNVIDSETRCTHYHSELDIIAIKFYCCDTYYPCYQCHEESGCGDHKVWPTERFDKKAVLCGCCGHELTVNEYLGCNSKCPSCGAGFNPGCQLHRELYFE